MGKEEQQNKEAEKDQKVANAEEQEVTATEEEQPEESTASNSEKDGWEQKYQDVNDKYLRLYSDFDNFRKRTMKEKSDLISSANAGVIKDLLPIIDDFERAIHSNQEATDPEGLKEGFQLIYNKMKNILESKGLKPMDSQGIPFDMDLHEAITNIPAPSDEDKGKVMDVVEKGYYLKEKVIRYAKVVVGQ